MRAREGRGQALRRRGHERPTETPLPGWTVLEVPFTDADTFADEVTGYGPDVVVQEPPEVRELVVARLRGAIGQEAMA
jgi:proteasome accessory factor B